MSRSPHPLPDLPHPGSHNPSIAKSEAASRTGGRTSLPPGHGGRTEIGTPATRPPSNHQAGPNDVRAAHDGVRNLPQAPTPLTAKPVSKKPAELAPPAKPNSRQPARQVGRASGGGKGTWQTDSKESPDPILFQTYFKSVGPRTYAAQLKRAKNGNQYLVLTEGKRDKVTEEVRKTRLYIYSEDFVGLFKLLKQTAEFIRANPVPADIARKRSQYWAKRQTSTGARQAAQA